MARSATWTTGIGLLMILAAAGAVGCASTAADTLDVTYYYLPG